MRATLDYFEAKEAEIRRLEDTPAGVPTTPSAVPVLHTPMAASVSPATTVNATKAERKKTKSVGAEDSILLKCIGEYIENNKFSKDHLERLKEILAIWRGYDCCTPAIKKKIKHYQDSIFDIQRGYAEDRRINIENHNGTLQVANTVTNNRNQQ